MLSTYSCTPLNIVGASYKTPDSFIPYSNCIKIESNNDSLFANEIASVLQLFQDSVEIKLHHKFKNVPMVFICNSKNTYCKYTEQKYIGPRASVNTNGIFISPRLKESPYWSGIIYHEYVHSLMFQYLGSIGYFKIPIWFHEGLATLVSNGGGSGDISDTAAFREILKGKHFYPYDNFLISFLFNNHLPSAWIAYRQYMVFTEYIKKSNPVAFNAIVQSIFEKKSFSKSYNVAYGKNVDALWNTFVNSLKNKEL